MSYTSFKLVRESILHLLNEATIEQVDAIPERFNNNIRWNAGHVVTVANRVLPLIEGYNHQIPEHYNEFFAMGTSPSDWTTAPPSVAEITEQAHAQLKQIEHILEETPIYTNLQNEFDLRGTKFTTIGDLLGFLTYHEGMHFDTIKILTRFTNN